MNPRIDDECLAPALRMGARSIVVGAKTIHLWGSVAPGGTVATWLDPPLSSEPVESQIFNVCSDAAAGLWQITSTAVEYRRNVSETPTLPLPDSAIRQIPAGIAPYTKRTVMGLRVWANDGADLRQFDMDANQSVAIVAQSVCIAWTGPRNTVGTDIANTVEILGMPDPMRERAPIGTRTGMVIDAFLGVSLSRIEQQPGDNSVVLCTRHLFVASGTRGSIEIPPYADEVTIYQEPTLGASSVMWTQTLGDPNGGSGSIALASLPFILGERRTDQESILPNVSHLQTDLDNTGNRFFTLVFRCRP